MPGDHLEDSLVNSFDEFYMVGEPPKAPLLDTWEKYKPKDFKNLKKVSGIPLLIAILLHSKKVWFKVFMVEMISLGFSFSKLYIMGKSI